MRKYVIRRFIQLIPILLGITLLSFILTNIGTTDVIDTMESNQGVVMSEEEKDQLRQEMGLDKPLAQQYVIWLGNVLRGDMGESFVSGKDVFDTFISKLPATIYLTVTSIFLTVLISIPLGILSAVKQNKFLDYLIRFLSFIGNSLPNFFVSLLLIYFFSLKLKLLPVMGNNSGWKSIILPTLTLAIAMSSKYTRQVRATVLEEYRIPSGRNGHCRIHLYVGRGGENGGRRHHHEGLSHHTGLRDLDGGHLCGSESDHRSDLSLS